MHRITYVKGKFQKCFFDHFGDRSIKTRSPLSCTLHFWDAIFFVLNVKKSDWFNFFYRIVSIVNTLLYIKLRIKKIKNFDISTIVVLSSLCIGFFVITFSTLMMCKKSPVEIDRALDSLSICCLTFFVGVCHQWNS